MQAFVEGKTIQRYDDKKDDWYDISPNANIDFCYDYRIKPEPKYRPFKTKEECWNEMHKHPDFGWLVNINTKNLHHVSAICHDGLRLDDNTSLSFTAAFSYYEFPDGSTFGLLEE